MSGIFLDDSGKNVQTLIRYGYNGYSRRTYFIRLLPKVKTATASTNASIRSVKFFKTGEIDLNQTAPDDLVNRLTALNKQWCASGKKGDNGLDIAFTYCGLEKLGIQPELLDVFRKKIPSFYDNAFIRAGKKLGDTGLSDPMEWTDIYRKDGGKGFDLILIAHFPINPKSTIAGKPQADSKLILNFENVLLEQMFGEPVFGKAGEFLNQYQLIRVLKRDQIIESQSANSWVEESIPLDLDTQKIYFGFRDGLTSPKYKLKPKTEKTETTKNIHALGEILLGHQRNDGDNAFADLRLTPKRSANVDPQPIPSDEHYKCFFKDSSFGVIRKMQQRKELFDKWLDKKAEKMVCGDYEWDQMYRPPLAIALPYKWPFDLPLGLTKEWIKAKLLGRTADGMLLTPTTKPTDLEDEKLNTFEVNKEGDFHRANKSIGLVADEEGKGCPFSSHIRRMNPREDPVTPFIYRPILRRGMPYTTSTQSFGEADVGLSGLFICADIAEQFEHLVGNWANNRVLGVKDASNCRDPLIGNHGGDGAAKTRGEFFLNSHAERTPKNQLTEFDEPFVVTRGCAYVWFPSISTLKTLTQYFIDQK